MVLGRTHQRQVITYHLGQHPLDSGTQVATDGAFQGTDLYITCTEILAIAVIIIVNLGQFILYAHQLSFGVSARRLVLCYRATRTSHAYGLDRSLHIADSRSHAFKVICWHKSLKENNSAMDKLVSACTGTLSANLKVICNNENFHWSELSLMEPL